MKVAQPRKKKKKKKKKKGMKVAQQKNKSQLESQQNRTGKKKIQSLDWKGGNFVF